jgi:predicted dehydrogenase
MAQSSFRAVDLKGEQSPGVFYRFVEAVRTARPMRPDFTDGLRLMRILDKIHEACESGRRVAVEG